MQMSSIKPQRIKFMAYHCHALIGRLEACLRIPYARWQYCQTVHVLVDATDQVLSRLRFVRHFTEYLSTHNMPVEQQYNSPVFARGRYYTTLATLQCFCRRICKCVLCCHAVSVCPSVCHVREFCQNE